MVSSDRQLEPALIQHSGKPGTANKAILHRYEELGSDLRSVIHNQLPKFEGIIKRQQNLDKGLSETERETVILGFALRLSEIEILREVNRVRVEEGKELALYQSINHIRKCYGELIDEIYANAVLRIGEIYKYADKFFRIGRYHELAGVLHKRVIDEFESNQEDELTIKKASLYLRTLEKLNVEMGGKSLSDLVRLPRDDADDGQDQTISKDEYKEIVSQLLQERYVHKLPPSISANIDFTDYRNCANGEKMGEYLVVCWNDKMTDKNAGSQCPIQAGKIRVCPKFLNLTLLDNKDWLLRTQQRNLSQRDIALLVGATEWDTDIRNRLAYYLKKHNIIDSMVRVTGYHAANENKFEIPPDELELKPGEDIVVDGGSEDSEGGSESTPEGDRETGSQ